jgi:CheY-like chemotaxis protein
MSGKCILIVEDETAIADGISYALRTDGFTPYHVTMGEAALAILRAADGPDIQLVVLDVGLPDINGFEVCRRLRQFSEVPVIFLTARADEIDRVVGLEIGADDYVTKPMGWTPPPRKGTVVSNWSFHTTSYRKGVHYEAYPCWGRFGKGCLPGSRR